MSPREREVRQYATALLSHLSVTTIPVDPVRIARRQGLAVEEGPLPSGVYGALWKKGNRFGIIVSDACPTPGHRRFSLAHELGHYHIDGHLDAMFAGDTKRVESAGEFHHHDKSPLEREADWFASELLVPASQLGSRIDEQPPSIGTLQSPADEFRTSLTMMAIRHAELTDRATASILSRDGRGNGPATKQGLHQEAGHTTVPDLHATCLTSKSGLPTRGRSHTAGPPGRTRTSASESASTCRVLAPGPLRPGLCPKARNPRR